MTYDSKYNAKQRDDKKTKESFEFAEKNWKPLYLIKMYEDDPALIEMSFDLTNYQPQFSGSGPTGPREHGARAPDSPRRANVRVPEASRAIPKRRNFPNSPPRTPKTSRIRAVEDHVFPNHFPQQGALVQMTRDEISKDKIILEKWWKQQSHRWTHYAYVVPWLWLINNANHTNYCEGGRWSTCRRLRLSVGTRRRWRSAQSIRSRKTRSARGCSTCTTRWLI